VAHTTDLDLTGKEVVELASPDAIAAFLVKLGYDTSDRALLSPEAVGLSGESASAIKRIELLSEDPEQFLRVVFAQTRSLTAKIRNDLVRVLGRSTLDHVLILTSDFDTLEFVFLDKRKREQKGPAASERIQVVPKTISVNRRGPTRLDLRTLRRFTWTCRDALEQFDKLRSVFDAAAYTGEYFQNRGLFSDYYLRDRLREDPAWGDNPSELFAFVRDLVRDAQARWGGKDKETLRNQLLEPLFKKLGFKLTVNRPSKTEQTQPDYLLKAPSPLPLSPEPGERGQDGLTAAFVYAWDRWLDGPDLNDTDTPEENPGACVVSALDEGNADWIIVTNGRLWRLYSRHAHARATNFYEVDLVEALSASGDTDPNEAFRYWSLFFRPDAYVASRLVSASGERVRGEGVACWLDGILQGSREYAKRLGERLKERIFVSIFPHLAQGFLQDRKHRLGQNKQATEQELAEIFEATLTLLYRLLFLLYAESRDLIPVREAPYRAASLKKLKEEIAERAGVAESGVTERLQKVYSSKETTLYDRLCRLFLAMDKGDPILNVPTYNGGLFNTPASVTRPESSKGVGSTEEPRDRRIARFLLEHKIPDQFLALAIDLLARDQDERTLALVFIDYKSLEVRHLGSIYEGLLEFKLKVADEDLTTQTDKQGEKYIPLSEAGTARRRKPAGVVVSKGAVYLSNDKAERKASGSYYTPDPIVEYIVTNTVGPVLDEKLEALRGDFRKVRKTFDKELQKSKAYPSKEVASQGRESTEAHRQWAGQQTYNAHKDLVEQLFDLRVLDPAMGSGHFLVETVDFITDRLLKFLNQFPINPVNFALDRTRQSILESLGEQGVSVDPAKLTDINLLKRHVLKRCIYGVDLNPMAVELAKVSLWLDCFTLGAPLNFLDHHLRCGNSLIGATFEGLEHAAAGPLFVMQYEPLLRAIQHVFFVSKLADATAAEVHRSAEEYADARKELSGYKIGLDLVTAQYFGFPKAPGLLTSLEGSLNFSNREQLLYLIKKSSERELVDQVEVLAERPDLRFFHWEIEFPEVFFGFADASQRQVKHKNMLKGGSPGFDCVVGNPPYDVLAEKELGRNVDELLGFFNNGSIFEPAHRGKQNLYKLFICRGVHLLRQGGRLGHIVPMPLLGDEQAAGVRKHLLTNTCLAAVEAFPQKDDPKNRVFEDAKLSTCVFVTANKTDDLPFRSRVHPGKTIEPSSPSVVIRPSEVKLYDPENQPIVACSQEDWDLAVKIMGSGRVRRLGEFGTAYQGEVNETTDAKKGNISGSSKDGPLILRGANLCLYKLRGASQGEPLYLRKKKYLHGKRPDAKAWHHKQDRVGFQRNSPQNNFRRLIACYIPAEQFCCDTVSYFPEKESKLPLNIIMALFNSKLLDWFFRLGSTNSKVNDYQVNVLPAPVFARSAGKDSDVPRAFRKSIERGKLDEALTVLEPLLSQPPFSSAVMVAIAYLVEQIMRVENQRGEIARAERSALAPESQPYQDLIDWILYCMAGLTDAEAQGLEKRLEGML
jgi:hypothetical protein